MQFRMRSAGPGAGLGCGGFLVVLGVILVSPVGEVLIKGLGWLFIILGAFIAVSGVYLWIRRPRRGPFL